MRWKKQIPLIDGCCKLRFLCKNLNKPYCALIQRKDNCKYYKMTLLDRAIDKFGKIVIHILNRIDRNKLK